MLRVDQPNFLDDSELKNNEEVPYFINRQLKKLLEDKISR